MELREIRRCARRQQAQSLSDSPDVVSPLSLPGLIWAHSYCLKQIVLVILSPDLSGPSRHSEQHSVFPLATTISPIHTSRPAHRQNVWPVLPRTGSATSGVTTTVGVTFQSWADLESLTGLHSNTPGEALCAPITRSSVFKSH